MSAKVNVLLVTELFIGLRIVIHCLSLPPRILNNPRYPLNHHWSFNAIEVLWGSPPLVNNLSIFQFFASQHAGLILLQLIVRSQRDLVFMSVAELHPNTEVASFMRFLTDLYDRQRLVIVTSNFPLIEGGIMGRVASVDKIGRTISRAA